MSWESAMGLRRWSIVCCVVAWGCAATAETPPTAMMTSLPGVPLVAPPEGTPAVAVTWYGVSTLLFDDGETKILTDGFFSRPLFESLESIAEPNMAQIARMVETADLQDLAMITAVHSHFDHAMDVGEVARATGAKVFASESTANVARGAGVDESQIVVVDDRRTERYGEFAVTLIRSAHLPLENGGPPIPGTIDAPLVPPAPIGAWKEGGSYSVVIEHPAGTAVVQGSAGYVEGRLDDVTADVVYLGVGGVGIPGKDHVASYFEEIVKATGAGCARPVHWDDFNRPFGEIAFMGDREGAEEGISWVREFAAAGDPPVGLATLPFGQAVDAFAGCGTRH